MSVSANPIASEIAPRLLFSSHAQFRMEERDVDTAAIHRLLTSPKADVQVDEKSGHFVFKTPDYRVVVKEIPEHAYLVVSVFRTDQSPF